MPTNDGREAEAATAEPHETLARIAELLNVPVEALTDHTHDPLNVEGLSELLRIWFDMGSAENRARLLEFARRLAAS